MIDPFLIEMADVSVLRNGRAILDSISLTVARGGHTAILGPNGCGKTTLIRVMTREIYPHAGRGFVRVLCKERWVLSQLRTMLGVVLSEPVGGLLGEPTALEMAVSGLIGTYGILPQHEVSPRMMEMGGQALGRMGIERLADQPFSSLSTGEQRRVVIARALISDPPVLVLDEPTSGLDLKASQEFLGTLRRLMGEGITLLLVTHNLEELMPEIERTVLMKQGRIMFDGPTEEAMRADRLSNLYDASLQVSRSPGAGYRAKVIG